MMTRITSLALGSLLAFSACADPELSQKVTDLETQLKTLEDKIESGAGAAAPGAAKRGPDPAVETAARAAFKEIQDKVGALDFEGAKPLCETALSKFAASETIKRQGRICDEVAVVGKDAMELEVDKWFQGSATMGDADATLLVFWEQWCPHCKREVPEIEATFNDYKGRLNVVGLTKVNRSSTDEKVEAFIQEKKLSYPMAKEKGGNLSRYYNVSGVPAAVVVKGGKVVWRGHPARLKDGTLDKLL